MAKQATYRPIVVFFLCCCVAGVVTEVELAEGESPLNSDDPVQYKDCRELHKAGYNVTGPHVLYMNKTSPFLILCEFTKDQVYNVMQQRVDYSVNFIQTMDVYTKGFGYAQTDYWAGLDAISHLTLIGNKVLDVFMQDSRGVNENVHYSRFVVQPQHLGYQMTAAGFRGKVQDDLGHSTGMTFHTYDSPDSNGCATAMKAGWWYNYCAYTLPNGYYYPPGIYNPMGRYFDGMFWQSFGGFNNSLKFFKMVLSSN